MRNRAKREGWAFSPTSSLHSLPLPPPPPPIIDDDDDEGEKKALTGREDLLNVRGLGRGVAAKLGLLFFNFIFRGEERRKM